MSVILRIAVVTMFSVACTGTALAQFEEMGRYIPTRSNAVAFLNLDKIFSSSYAKDQGWIQNDQIHFPTCPLHAPEHTTRAVLAAEFDVTNMNTLWEASFFEMQHGVNLAGFEVFAQRKADKILGLDVVETSGRSFLVKLSDTVMANVFPASRQFVARQLSTASSRGIKTVSPYLQEAFTYASHDNDPAEIILAIDLSNVFDAQQISEHPILKRYIEERGVDADQLVQTLTSLRGLMVGVRIGDKPFGRLKIDFGQNASVLADDGKELVLDVFRGMGIMIDEFEDWTAKVEGTEFFLEGFLGDAAIQQITSVIDPPSLHAMRETPSRYGETGVSIEALSTKEHFRTVDVLVRQLRTQKSNSRGAKAFFYERYARKVDRLPMLNVDPEMLDYSAQVADLMRDVAAAERGVAVSSAAVGKQFNGGAGGAGSGSDYGYRTGFFGYQSGYYGYYYPRSYSSLRRAAAAGIVEQGAKRKYELLAEIDRLAGEIRRKMTEKYQIEF